MWAVLRDWLALLAVLNSALVSAFVWAARRATKDDVGKVDGRCAAIEARVSSLEHLGKMLPTREDLHLLRLEMMEAGGSIKSLVKELEGDRRQFAVEIQSTNRHVDEQMKLLDKLVGRAETGVRMLTEHQLNKGK